MLRNALISFTSCILGLLFTTNAIALDCPSQWSGEPCTSTELPEEAEVCTASGGFYPLCQGSEYADRFMAYTDGNDGFVFGEINSVEFCCTSDDFGNAGHLGVQADDGDDIVYTYFPCDTPPSWENDTTIEGEDDDDEIYLNPYEYNTESATGGDGDDTIMGNAGEDNIYGKAGNDTLDAGDGDTAAGNVVHGGTGNDYIYGSDYLGVTNYVAHPVSWTQSFTTRPLHTGRPLSPALG